MAHKRPVIDGVEYPSVTEVVGILDKPFLVPWAAKHGVLKAEAVAEAIQGAADLDREDILDEIPVTWFSDNKLTREDFWKGHEELGKEAQERGKKFHEDVEHALKNLVNGVAVDVTSDVWAVCEWTRRAKFEPLKFEQYVESRKYKYGGTFDCSGQIDKKPILIDWKRTGQISENYVLQLAAYAQAHYETFGAWIAEGRIIRPYELKRPAKEDSCEEMASGIKWSFKGSCWYVEERVYEALDHYIAPFVWCRKLYDFLNKKGEWER